MATAKEESTIFRLEAWNQSGRHAEREGIHLVFKVSPEMNARLEELCKVTGLEMGELINRAVGLFKGAVEAIEQGKHVGIAASSDDLEIEYTGLTE